MQAQSKKNLIADVEKAYLKQHVLANNEVCKQGVMLCEEVCSPLKKQMVEFLNRDEREHLKFRHGEKKHNCGKKKQAKHSPIKN